MPFGTQKIRFIPLTWVTLKTVSTVHGSIKAKTVWIATHGD